MRQRQRELRKKFGRKLKSPSKPNEDFQGSGDGDPFLKDEPVREQLLTPRQGDFRLKEKVRQTLTEQIEDGAIFGELVDEHIIKVRAAGALWGSAELLAAMITSVVGWMSGLQIDDDDDSRASSSRRI